MTVQDAVVAVSLMESSMQVSLPILMSVPRIQFMNKLRIDKKGDCTLISLIPKGLIYVYEWP